MASVYKRGRRLWCRIKNESGTWDSKKSPYMVGQEKEAQRYADKAQELINKRIKTGDTKLKNLTVKEFAGAWVEKRKESELDWKNDKSRLKHHVIPFIGELLLKEVRAKDLLELFAHIRNKKERPVAPRTVYNIYSVVSAMFRDAVLEDLLEQSPCILTGRQLGPLVDKNPEWRASAVFSRDEVETLIADEQLPVLRRVVYALKFLAGLRHGETAALRWRHYEDTMEPLGRLLIAGSFNSAKGKVTRTKTDVVRKVPVHPVLFEVLETWRRVGWVNMMGRQPEENDLIVPLPPEVAARRRKKISEPFLNKAWARKRLVEDLELLGMRHRRGHDARATFITLAGYDGADEGVLETQVTHTRKPKGAFAGYDRRDQWVRACNEVSKLRISLKTNERSKNLATSFATNSPSEEFHLEKVVEAPGVEPGSENMSPQASTCVFDHLKSPVTSMIDNLHSLASPS